jgi:hypothetical protein
VPALFNHVLHIVFVRPKEQVIGVAAGPNIAFVEDVQAVRDGAAL